MRQAWIRYGRFLFKYRDSLFPVVLLMLLIVFPPRLPFSSVGMDRVLDGVGIAVMASGLVLRGLVIGLQYIRRGGVNKQVYASELVTGGIFAASRNPLYVGNFLLLLGVIILSGNPWVYVIGILLSLTAYRAIVAAEEDFLSREFGGPYRDYCRSVNRWLPALAPVVRALREMPFNWPRVVVKDYNTVYLWLTVALSMLTYEHLSIAAYRQDWADQLPLGFAFLGLTVVYLVARVLKKKRILTPEGRARAA